MIFCDFLVQIDVPGEPLRSRGVPGSISGLKPRRTGPKIFSQTCLQIPSLSTTFTARSSRDCCPTAADREQRDRAFAAGGWRLALLGTAPGGVLAPGVRAAWLHGRLENFTRTRRPFRGSGRPRGPGKPFQKMRGFAPHLLEWFPGPGRPDPQNGRFPGP